MRERIFDARDLGSAMRTRRKELGLTQGELAEFCGVSVSFISDMERGKSTVEVGKMLFVASNLGIDFYAVDRGGRL